MCFLDSVHTYTHCRHMRMLTDDIDTPDAHATEHVGQHTVYKAEV